MRRVFESFTEAAKSSTEDWGYNYSMPKPTTEEANTWWNNIRFREEIPYKDSVAPVTPDLGGFTMLGIFYAYSTQKRNCFDCEKTYGAHYAKDKSTRLLVDKNYPLGVRPYSVREYARLQGVPDSFEFNCTDTEAYRMIGNGVSVPVGLWAGLELKRYFA